ncbi:tyrosine-type recombinase/integrase [Bacillus thuringiensis]
MRYKKLNAIIPFYKTYRVIELQHIEGTFFNFLLKIELNGKKENRLIEIHYSQLPDEMPFIIFEETIEDTFYDQLKIFNLIYDDLKQKYEELRKPFRLQDVLSGKDKKLEVAEIELHGKESFGELEIYQDIPVVLEQIEEFNEKFRTFFLPVRTDFEAYIQTLTVAASTKKSYLDGLESFFRYLFDNKIDRMTCFDEQDINDFIAYKVEKEERKTSYLRRLLTVIFDYCRHTQRFLDKKKIKMIENHTENKGIIRKVRIEMIEEELYKKYREVATRDETIPKLSKLRDKKRNYILFKLILETGSEINELLQCNLEDIVIENGVTGIKIEDRFVPLNQKTYNLMQNYISFRKKQDIEEEKIRNEIAPACRNRKVGNRIYYKKINGSKTLWEDYEKTREQFERDRALESKSAKIVLNDKFLGICSNAIVNYVNETFVFNNSLFVSNRYRRISKVTVMEILRKLGVTSTALRERAIQTFISNGLEIEDIVRLIGNADDLNLEKYRIKDKKKKKRLQDIESDLPEREI